MALPSTTAIGGLVAQPDVKFSSGGKSFTVGRIACNDRKRDAQGNWVDGDATFLDFIIFGDMGERFAESVGKGDQVVLVGSLQQREYETSEGEKRTTYGLRVDEAAVSVRFRVARPDQKQQEKAPAAGSSWS